MKVDIIYNEDCLEGMKRLPDESVDLVLTDPPYNRGYFSKHNISFSFLDEAKRILKRNHCIYCFWTPKTFCEFEKEFTKRFGLLNIIICQSPNKIGFGSPYRWQKTYEPLYFGEKGNSLISIRRQGLIKNCFDVWSATMPQSNFTINKSYHPTQKAMEFILNPIQASTNKDDIVLDPFVGSGTTAVACKRLDRHYIGFEINPEYCEIAKKRLEAEETLWNRKGV